MRSLTTSAQLLPAAAVLAVALFTAPARAQSTHPGGGVGPAGVVPSTPGPGDTLPRPAGPLGAPRASGLPGTPTSRPRAIAPTVGVQPPDVHSLITALERDENDWRIWWRLNRDPFLVVDPSHARPDSSDGGFYLGEGDGTRPRLVAARQVIENVVPELAAALESESSPAVRVAILVALGRAGDLVSDETAARVLQACADPDRGVREAAVVAACLRASPRDLRTLVHLLHACDDGRALLGERPVDARMQAFTALALGLGVQRSTNTDLRQFVLLELARAAARPSHSPDLPAACVAAVGILPLGWDDERGPAEVRSVPHLSREGQVAWLLDALDAENVHREVRGQAALALGRLAQDAPVDWREVIVGVLVERLDAGSGAPSEVRQSAAVALGILGTCGEGALGNSLRDALREATREGDTLTRRFALIAIGRVAARDARRGSDVEQGRDELREHLLKSLARGRGGLDAWAALALGRLEHERFIQGEAPSLAVQAALEEKLAESRSPATAGAFGLGLAFSKAPAATAELLEALERNGGDEQAAAALSIALGLSRGPGARERLTETIVATRGRPALLHDAALGLALSGDFSGTPLLVRTLADTGAIDSRAALASALGRTGDTRAIEPLQRALVDRSALQAQRALAARALGWLVDQGGAPVWTPLSCDLSWGADTASLAGVEGGDLLALLRDF